MHLLATMGDLATTAPAVLAWIRLIWDGFAQGVGATGISAIWQGAVIVCGLEIILRLMPRMSAAHRFVVWATGFAVAAGLPLLSLIHFGSSGEALASGGTGGTAHALLQVDARWGLAFAGLWLAGSGLRGIELIVHSIRLRGLWRDARPVDVSQNLENLLAALRNVRDGRVKICTVERLDRPSVIGFFAPRILIPGWLFGRLTAGELEQIVLHEAEHLRRRDDWTNLIQKLVLVAFPLNPALAWMEHRLCREREMACDEGVVSFTNAPRAYAACLTSLAERGLERQAEALSLGAWHKRSELAHRVHGILLRKSGVSRRAAGLLLAAVGCALVAGTVEMARVPELVAFVPKQKALAMTPARLRQMTALLGREDADSAMMLPPGYHPESTKAIVPGTRQAIKAPRHAGSKVAFAGKPGSGELAQKMARAEAIGDHVNAGAEQQWIVLSAWEEVQTISPANGSDKVIDYDANATPGATEQANGNAASADKAKPRQPSRRYTVTQLILRVVPASPASNSTQPAGMTHGGWFVIQL